MSSYLDILWGAETIPWSMYYLNGLDNSLILVSTLPLKDLSSSFKESTITSVVESRRAEMLLQANTLDERKPFPLCAASPGRMATILPCAPPLTSRATWQPLSPLTCRLTT